MKQTKTAKLTAVLSPDMSMERLRFPRVPVSFGLMYSCIRGDVVPMGDGTVVDLSKAGLGIRGNHPVKVGMELTLFLYLPDGEDPLFILEARVAWTGGGRFGVEFKKRSLREGSRLHLSQCAQTIQPA